ncbi:MAG TPA: zf-HC2 domain-containing protein [Thermoanaerobaculia bacterium]
MTADANITRYLLGELRTEEQERLEQQYFTNPEMLALVEATEDDLIDSYLRGELSDEERARFESHFLRSRRRRERVKTAEALLAQLPRKASRAPFYWAAAAALVVLFGLWSTGSGERTTVTVANGTTATTGIKTTTAQPQPAVQRLAVVLALTPGVTRDDTAATPRLDLRRPADDVILTPVTDADGPLTATLRLGDKEVWSSANVATPPRLTIPAQQFVTGDYLLTLRDKNGEVIDDYGFFVTR